MEPDKLRAAYLACFDTPEGKVVLRDLGRISTLNKINADCPDSGAAIYRVAQQDLVRRIKRMIGDDDRTD